VRGQNKVAPDHPQDSLQRDKHRGRAGSDLLLRHDTPLIAAVLAVWKAGRCVVVLNTTDPVTRLAATHLH
jgi:hypothetical protein